MSSREGEFIYDLGDVRSSKTKKRATILIQKRNNPKPPMQSLSSSPEMRVRSWLLLRKRAKKKPVDGTKKRVETIPRATLELIFIHSTTNNVKIGNFFSLVMQKKS